MLLNFLKTVEQLDHKSLLFKTQIVDLRQQRAAWIRQLTIGAGDPRGVRMEAQKTAGSTLQSAAWKNVSKNPRAACVVRSLLILA